MYNVVVSYASTSEDKIRAGKSESDRNKTLKTLKAFLNSNCYYF